MADWVEIYTMGKQCDKLERRKELGDNEIQGYSHRERGKEEGGREG